MSVMLDIARKIERELHLADVHYLFAVAANEQEYSAIVEKYEASTEREITQQVIFKLY